MKQFAIAFASFGCFFLASCATKFTQAQKDALATVSISPTEVKSGAYLQPNGADRQAADSATMSGTSSGAGALGGLVGALVGESIAASQNAIFKGKSKQHFDAVAKNTPEISRPVNSKLGGSIKSDTFFAPRLRSDSPNRFTSKVISYGLVRSGKQDDGTLLLTPQVAIEISLKDASGKKLVGRNYIGTGYNHPITRYASDQAELRKGYELAAGFAVDQFASDLSKKTAE
jgi:hypothetical protein